MSPEFLEFINHQITQLGLPTATLALIVYVLYKICIKILIPTAERLVQGHLTFLDEVKMLLKKNTDDLISIKGNLEKIAENTRRQ